jgi:RimJ/RimL family protein N-acetyltransferase
MACVLARAVRTQRWVGVVFQAAMIKVMRALPEDVPRFVAMEQASDAREYILPYPESEHAEKMQDANIVYLRILDDADLAGFFILALDPDNKSIEFRRIVVSTKGRGVGQQAITAMEQFCRRELKRDRIWLDVFEHNYRGRRIYEKLGYEKFGNKTYGDRLLLLYQKQL